MALADSFVPGVYEYKDGDQPAVRITVTPASIAQLIDVYKTLAKTRVGTYYLKRIV